MIRYLRNAAPVVEREHFGKGLQNLNGDEHYETLGAAINYASSLVDLQRFEEARSLMRKKIPVARRVLGESDDLTLRMKTLYAQALYKDAGATLADHREAVTTLEDTERIVRRVLGGAHPTTVKIERALPAMRDTLADREGDDVSAVRAALDAMKAT